MKTLDIAQYPVTYAIIGINFIVFLLIHAGKLHVKNLGTSYMLTLQQKQYYRIVTSAFTQAEFMHLAMNMYSLYNLGSVLEYAIGPRIYVICYGVIMLLEGILSAMIHKKKSPFTLCIGASGVLCGLLGIYMVIAYSVWGFAGIKSVIPTIAILIFMTTSPKIDSIGHFTGLAVGIICGIALINIYSFGY